MSFLWISGRPSLDYVGTLRWRRGPEPREYLSQPSDLADWGIQSGQITEPPRVTPAQLTAARELRDVIYRMIFARINGANPGEADVTALNAAARRPPVELSLGGDGAVRRVGTVSQLLSALARDALDLLGSDQIGLVRECDGPTCSRLYVDSSRARNRRWCSNTECGNQAKVAAFRRRARSLPDPIESNPSKSDEP
jgi:predicted RNA-binding Zn ribbon-like protein